MINDDELQRKIENKEPAGDSADAKAYLKIFNILEKESFHLSDGFADTVVRRLQSRGSFVTDYLWMGIGLFCFLGAGIATAIFTKFTLNFGSFKFISGYAGLIIFSVLFILAFQLIDKGVIRKNLSPGS